MHLHYSTMQKLLCCFPTVLLGKQLLEDSGSSPTTPSVMLCCCLVLMHHTAFLASRNKPSVDKQLFEDSSGWRKRGGRRRNVMGADRQVIIL